MIGADIGSGQGCVSIVIPVYRDATRAIALCRSLRDQELPPGVEVEFIVVDDGSDDGAALRIEDSIGDWVTLRKLPRNEGRANARNIGAFDARGDLILFMDCDCLPADNHLITAHLGALAPGVVATIGPVTGDGTGFWHRYQSVASARRARQHATGMCFSGSSQNLMVSRAAFDACGGFDRAYRTYGFEDRDLQLRIAQYGRIAWAANASVRHMDALTLSLVCRKMAQAGGLAACVFSRRHPEAYQALGYAALDVRLHPWLRLPGQLLSWLIEPMVRIGDPLLANPYVPYGLKNCMAKALTGIAYLVGTTQKP